MRGPDRPGGAGRGPVRDALLRPLHLLMVAIGVVAFALTLTWWVLPLTFATYAALVFLAVRYPPPGDGAPQTPRVRPSYSGGGPPEQRLRRLPRGPLRGGVEAALEARRRALFAVEESDDATRAALNDAVPKLDAAVERLVDAALAQSRQRHAERETEILSAAEEISTVRTRVVRVSTETEATVQEAAAGLNADLDALNLRLDALISALSRGGRADR